MSGARLEFLSTLTIIWLRACTCVYYKMRSRQASPASARRHQTRLRPIRFGPLSATWWARRYCLAAGHARRSARDIGQNGAAPVCQFASPPVYGARIWSHVMAGAAPHLVSVKLSDWPRADWSGAARKGPAARLSIMGRPNRNERSQIERDWTRHRHRFDTTAASCHAPARPLTAASSDCEPRRADGRHGEEDKLWSGRKECAIATWTRLDRFQ